MSTKSIALNGNASRQTAYLHALQTASELAAIYARVSTTDQADKGYSLPTQIEACQRLAQQEGYTVPESHIFVDDYTGTSLNRPQFTKLRDLVHHRLVQAVIVYDLDRLSRKLAHQLLLSEEFEQAGVTLHIVTMPASDKTPETQLLSNVRGVIAEYERSKILERTMRGLRGRAQAGYVPGGTTPLGYRYVKHPQKGGYYEVDAEEAAMVREIFALYTTDGLSLKQIARQLTEKRVLTCQDRRKQDERKYGPGIWYESAVARILSKTAYIGTVYWGKHERQTSPNNPDKKTAWRRKDPETWQPIAVPPIIDETIFEIAQARKRRNL